MTEVETFLNQWFYHLWTNEIKSRYLLDICRYNPVIHRTSEPQIFTVAPRRMILVFGVSGAGYSVPVPLFVPIRTDSCYPVIVVEFLIAYNC